MDDDDVYYVDIDVYKVLTIIFCKKKKMNQMRIVISRIPACSIVALMFLLIGIVLLRISLSSFF